MELLSRDMLEGMRSTGNSGHSGAMEDKREQQVW